MQRLNKKGTNDHETHEQNGYNLNFEFKTIC